MPAKDNKFVEVDEAIVAAALAGNANFHSNPSVQLRFLDTSAQLCRLFEHSRILGLGDFILQNKLTGLHLLAAVDSIDDLTELGLDKLTAKLILNFIAVWKERGLPADFSLIEPSACTPPPATNGAAEDPVGAENPQERALPFRLSQESEGFQVTTSAADVSQVDDFSSDTAQDVDFGVNMTEDVPQDHDNAEEKQLDDDFIAARWCWSRAATDRIFATAGFGNHLAQGYLSILYNNSDNFVGKDRSKAE
eukprot:gene22250-25213_t